jgi:hypothetical protein
VSTEQGENGHDIPVRSMTLPVLYKARWIDTVISEK